MGTKLGLAHHRVQLNLSGFYYDYGDKQLIVLFSDPIYTVLARLANIPHSHAYGVDGDITWAVTDNLTATFNATYLQTYIGSYLGVDENGATKQFKGSQFPYAPHFQGAVTLNYNAPITNTLALVAAINDHFQTSSCADLCNRAVYKIDAYQLLNASIGVQSLDGHWGSRCGAATSPTPITGTRLRATPTPMSAFRA